MRKQRKKCLVLLSITVLLLFTAAFAEKLCPYDPYAQDLSISMKAPNLAHPFGTDRYGRDLLSRVLAGSTVSVFSTLLLIAIVTVLGTAMGLFCGWYGGRLDSILMRISDLFLAFPGLVFALAVAGVLGGGIQNAVLALMLIGWPKFCETCQKSDTGAEKINVSDGSKAFWKQWLENSYPSCSAKYCRTDSCNGCAGYRNHADGACRPVFSGTGRKTAYG